MSFIISACDHCRIGSLENRCSARGSAFTDHCRIGSLEMSQKDIEDLMFDHCRIGSLEIDKILEILS